MVVVMSTKVVLETMDNTAGSSAPSIMEIILPLKSKISENVIYSV